MAAFILFLKANWVEISTVSYVVLDAVIYFVPSLKANGLLQQLELWLKGQSTPPAA
jgi:hypothetical protein